MARLLYRVAWIAQILQCIYVRRRALGGLERVYGVGGLVMSVQGGDGRGDCFNWCFYVDTVLIR